MDHLLPRERLSERRKSHNPDLEALVNPNYKPQIMSLLEQVQAGLDKEIAHTEIMEMLIETASKDRKTGLDLGEAAIIKLSRLIKYSGTTGMPLTVIYLDADNFKRINDEINYETGNKVIRAMAKAIQETTRTTDMQARLNEEADQKDIPYNDKEQARMGGDEFFIALPEATPEQAEIVLQRFRERLSLLIEDDVPEYQAAFSSTLTVSAGIIQYNPNIDSSPADLILRAETTMKQVKQVNNKIVSTAVL